MTTIRFLVRVPTPVDPVERMVLIGHILKSPGRFMTEVLSQFSPSEEARVERELLTPLCGVWTPIGHVVTKTGSGHFPDEPESDERGYFMVQCTECVFTSGREEQVQLILKLCGVKTMAKDRFDNGPLRQTHSTLPAPAVYA